MNKAKIIYFDTNIYRDLAEKRISKADEKLSTLRNKIEKRELIICQSFEVLAEIVLLLGHDKKKFLELYALFCDLINVDCIIRPSNQLIVNSIKGFAVLDIINPFVQPDEDLRWVVNKFRDKQEVAENEKLLRVCKDTIKERKKFIRNVLMPFDDAMIRKMKANFKKAKNAKEDVLSYLWGENKIVETIAIGFADHIGLKDECLKQGIGKLLKIPSIRIPIGYIINAWYRRIDVDAVEKASSAYDFRHAICAGAVGNIVTHDRKFKQAIENIPEHGIKVFSLDEVLLI